jgi:NAD(P)-dependent dehydrogenase (short-subunit alcohol dehydrogenase family)
MAPETPTQAASASTVAVLGWRAGVPLELAAALARRGARAAVVGPDGEADLPPPGVAAVPCAFRSAEEVGEALQRVTGPGGRLGAVVDAMVVPAATRPRPLMELAEGEWAELAEEALRSSLYALQAARGALGEGGRILLLGPSLSMSGAAGLVAWVAASEGRRALVKIAARAWGSEGITVNWLGVPAGLLAGTGDELDRPGTPPPSLPRPGVEDVAGVVQTFLDPAFAVITGSTLAVDGGVWMNP